ncbi:MAG: hypothetical protein V5A27_06240 [Halapricum sp.]|jgi:hypothetical protein
MTGSDSPVEENFDPIDEAERKRLEARMERYEDQLNEQGYEVAIAEGGGGFFAGVLVIDDAQGRFGFLEENGSVTWITGNVGGIGALGSAVAQNPSEQLQQEVEGLENADVE